MPSIADLFVSVTSDVSGAIDGLTDVDKKVNGTSSAMQAATPAAFALAGAATAVGAGFLSSVNVAADFEHQINGVKAVMSPAEVNQFGDAVAKLAITLGKDTVFTSAQAADAIETLIKAGVPLPAILDGGARSALDLASATGTDVTLAATLAATALNTFHLAAADLPDVMDSISNISNATATSVEGLKLALAAVGPVAAGVGLSFNDTAEALGIFANNGLQGSDAGTSLKTMLLNLEPSTKSQVAAFKELGLITADGSNKFFDATGSARSMSEIFQVLKDATSGLTAEQKINLLQTAFGTDAVRAATIAANEGAAGWDAVSAAMDKMGGTAAAAAQRNSGLVGSMNQLQGSFEAIQITVGNLLLPTYTRLIDTVTGLLNQFLSLDPATQNTIIRMVGVAGAVAGLVSAFVLLGPTIASVVGALGAIAFVTAEVAVPLAALGLAAQALYQAWQTNFAGVRDVTLQVWEAIQPAFANILGFMQSLTSGSATGGFLSSLQPLAAALEPFVAGALAQLPGLVRSAGDAFNALSAAMGPVAGVFGSLVAAFATGGGSLGLVIDAIRLLFGGTVSGALTPFLQWFTDALPELQRFASNVGSLFQAFAAVVGKIFQGDLPGALALFQTDVVSAGAVLVTQLTEWAQAFIDWVTPLIPPLLAELGKIASAVANWIITVGLPVLLSWAQAFLNWVAPMIPPLLTELGKIALAIAQWVIGELPVLINVLLQLGTAFLSWILPVLPSLLNQLAQLFGSVVVWIIGTALPMLANAALQFGSAFLGWVAPLIPQLLLELAQIGVTIATWVVGTALPLITQSLLQFGTAFLTWVLPVIPPLLLQLGNLLASVASWVVGTALPALAAQVFKWGPVFIDWIADTVPPLLAALGNFLLVMANWIVGVALPEIASRTVQWVGPFLSWITGSVIPQLGPALQGLLTFIGGQLALLPDIIIGVLGDPWAPFVNSTFQLGARIGTAIGNLAGVVSQNIGPVLLLIADVLTPAMDTLGAAFDAIGAAIGPVATILAALVATFTTDAGALGIVVAQIRVLFGDAVADALEPFIQWFQRAVPEIQRFADNVGNLFAAFAAVVQKIFAGDLPGALALFQTDVADAGVALVTQLASWAQAFIDWLVPVIPRLIAQLAGLLSGVIDWIAGAAPAIANQAGQWGAAFIGWVTLMLPKLPPMLEQIANTLLDFIATNVPKILGAMATWAGVFIGWVAPTIPPLLGALVGVLGEVTRWVVEEGLPKIGGILLTWANAFVAWVTPLIPPLLAELGKLSVQLLAWIVQEIPLMLQQLAQWAGAFIGWIGPMIPPFLAALGQLLLELGGWIIGTALPEIGRQLLSWAGAFLGWIGDQVIPQIGPALGALLTAIVNIMLQLPGAVQPAWDAFAAWFGGVLGGLPQFVADMAGDVWSALRGAFDGLVGQLQPAWDGFAGWLGGVLGGIPQFVGDMAGDVWAALRGAFDGLVGQLQPAWDTFAGWLGAVVGGIAQFVSDNMGDIFGGLVGAFSGLVDLLAPAWDVFAGWLAAVVGGIGQFVIDNMGDIWAGLVTAFNGMVDQLQPAWDAFAAWFGSVLAGIPQFVADNIGNVWGALIAALTGSTPAAGGTPAGGGVPAPAPGPIGGGAGITGPLVSIGTLNVGSAAEVDAFLQQMADAILAAAQRVSAPPPTNSPFLP